VDRRQQSEGAARFNTTGWQAIATWDQADAEFGIGAHLVCTIRITVNAHVRDANE
jgi:hypothetical protein